MPKRSPTTYRYRVTYQRYGWSHSQSKQYARLIDAENFCRKLQRAGRPDLDHLVRVELHRQAVGPWELMRKG